MSFNLYRGDLEKILDDAGIYGEDAVREGYSGRGMYGKECFGIVGDATTFFDFVVAATLILGYDEVQHFKHVATDSMGYDTIYYWRNVQVSDDESDSMYDAEKYFAFIG